MYGVGFQRYIMSEDNNEHFDLLGNKIEEGTPVAYPCNNGLNIGHVERLTPKMVKVRKLRTDSKRYRSSETILKYPHDVIVLDQKLVTMYLLKK